jgi:hypothetical protein
VESFFIACTTCQKRLRVRDASAVGEILICPHCGSMVLVEAPDSGDRPSPAATAAGPDAGSAAASGDEADTKPDLEMLAGQLNELQEPESPPLRPDPHASPLPPDATPPPVAVPPPASPTALPASAPAFASSSPAPPAADPQAEDGGDLALENEAPILPTEDWTSQAAVRRQQWLLVGGAALAGIVLAVILLGLLISWRRQPAKDHETVAAPDTPSHLETPTGDGVANPESADGDRQSQDETSAEATPPKAKPKPVASPHPVESEAKPEMKPPSKPDTPPEVPPEKSGDGADSEKRASDPNTAVSPKPDADAPAKKPADAETAKKTRTRPPPPADPAATEPGTVAEALDRFAPFLETDSFRPSPPAPPAEEPAGPVDVPEPVDDTESVPRPQPREIALEKRLADEIQKIQFQDVPLKRFVRFVTDFSTIPITFDPAALALVDRFHPVTVV